MKAVITDNNRDSRSNILLGLRLVPEGANDHLLIRLLERQYPAIVSGYGDGSVAVPIYEGNDEGLATSFEMSSNLEDIPDLGKNPGETLSFKTTYNRRGTLRHGMLLPCESYNGKVLQLLINGRHQPRNADGAFQLESLVFGAHLELTFSPVRDQTGRWITFSAQIVPRAPSQTPEREVGLDELDELK